METPLDRAHRALEDAPQDEAARLHFFERLADGELFLLLAEEAADESLHPEVFQLSDGAYVLAFDREERLGAFLGRPAAYAALSGRALAAMLLPAAGAEVLRGTPRSSHPPPGILPVDEARDPGCRTRRRVRSRLQNCSLAPGRRSDVRW